MSAPAGKELVRGAERDICLLAYAGLFLTEEHPEWLPTLIAKAEAGVRVRLLLGDPDGIQLPARDREHQISGGVTGRPSSRLAPLREAVLDTPRPKSWLASLREPKAGLLLNELASGKLPLHHAALHQHPEWRAAAHLRDLLMSCGLLPDVDKHLLHFESWLHRRTRELHDHEHLPLLEQSAIWHQLPKLHARARRRPLTASAGTHAAQQFNRAHEFLTWLHPRGIEPGDVDQAVIDRWYATHRLHEQRSLRAFLTWARATRRVPARLVFPHLDIAQGQRLTQHRRLELLRKVLNEASRPLRSRAAACLMLLYAQPASRIAMLTTDGIAQEDEGQVFIRFGDPPTPVPSPFDGLFLRARDERGTAKTSAAAELGCR